MTEDTRELVQELALGRVGRWAIPCAWIVIGAGALAIPTWLGGSRVWFAYGPVCFATAGGFILRASWFRWVAYLTGGAMAFLFGLTSLFALYPQLPLWWVGFAIAAFGVWTIVVAVAGFPRRLGNDQAA